MEEEKDLVAIVLGSGQDAGLPQVNLIRHKLVFYKQN